MFLLLLMGLSLCGITGACNKKFLKPSGTVTSPNYSSGSNYASNLDCRFDIEVDQGERIKLMWSSFDIVGNMPDCSTDYVEIFVGCKQNSIGKYCSSNFAEKSFYTVYSPDNCLRLNFHSDGSDSGKGFSATYSTYPTGSALGGACSLFSKRLTADSGVIISPGWPVRYPPLEDCYWKIELGQDKSIKMAFMDFDLRYDSGCNKDKVKVKSGDTGDSYDNSDTVKSSMCGSKSPFSLTSSKNVLWVRFKSDSFGSSHGFVAGYVLYESKESTAGVIVGVVVVVGVIAVIAGIVCFIVFYQRKRVRMAQSHVQQATVMTSVTHQSQAPQAPYAPPPPPQPSHVPPPYNQAVAAPYPKQDAPTPYPPDQYGGAPPYPTAYPGDAPPYPTVHAGDAPPYPTVHAGDAPPYPPGQPSGGFPYPPGSSASAPPYPPGPSISAPPYPPGPLPYPPEGYPSKAPLA